MTVSRRRRALVVGSLCQLALALALAGCTAGGGPLPASTLLAPAPPSPSSTSAATSPPASPAPDRAAAELAQAARSAGTALTNGPLTLTAAAADEPISSVARDDGSLAVTVVVAAEAEGVDRLAAVLAAGAGLRFEAQADRSIAVLDGDGAAVGALPSVVAADDTGGRLTARLTPRADDATLLDVVVDAGPAGTATVTFGASALVSADWGEREGGRSLAVVPAGWVRAGSMAAQEALWAAVVAAEPEADSASMRDQLDCHALGAPDKASWNLEPWRPEVDSLTMLAARCNP
ncbi:DUF2599 domain-containing protein [Pengzhenrongella sicca]|uniref:DUF2599 domain-containing protein n=1 Tax=Pengzhenrongella sicca TaxID=2819238 RepID=A0A8A4ZE82_9MICO|nr:DUF2599 domain-containing protein [Pengzhenrongella sicca]QTE29329.1 DUF2599 domain-containing protein [Pengzhenrongella sicca]